MTFQSLASNGVRLLAIGAILLAITAQAWRTPFAYAATITVTTTDDELNTDGDCSLREAIRATNTNAAVDACPAGNGADTINLPAGTYTLALPGTGEDAALTGDLDITEDLTLRGAGRAATTIDGANLDRVLHVLDGPTVIKDLRISGGTAGGTFGGGVLLDNGTLTLDTVRVTSNGGNVAGVAADPSTTLTIIDSRIDANAGASAGGILISAAANAIISNSDISENTSSNSNAGISSSGTLTISNSTISGNSANDDTGGLRSSGTTNLFNVTIANNIADSDADEDGNGGGISITAGTLTIRNSIIGDNQDNSPTTQHADCSGTLTSQGYNLLENSAGCTITGDTTGNITGATPRLDPLANNGGSSHTHALLPNSPAVDAGNPAGCTDANGATLTIDQRGFVRDSACDMGAYERGSPGTPTPTATPTATQTPTATRTATASPTRTPTGTRTQIPEGTQQPTSTPTATPTSTPSTSLTATPFSEGLRRLYLPNIVGPLPLLEPALNASNSP